MTEDVGGDSAISFIARFSAVAASLLVTMVGQTELFSPDMETLYRERRGFAPRHELCSPFSRLAQAYRPANPMGTSAVYHSPAHPSYPSRSQQQREAA